MPVLFGFLAVEELNPTHQLLRITLTIDEGSNE